MELRLSKCSISVWWTVLNPVYKHVICNFLLFIRLHPLNNIFFRKSFWNGSGMHTNYSSTISFFPPINSSGAVVFHHDFCTIVCLICSYDSATQYAMSSCFICFRHSITSDVVVKNRVYTIQAESILLALFRKQRDYDVH